MTNKEILEIALKQSAYDCNCAPADFLSEQNVVTISKTNPKARRYIPLPLECDLVSYGNNIVAQVSERTKSAVSEYINKIDVYHCFETPQINLLNDLLAPFDLKVCFMAEYFLPDMTQLKELDCSYDLRVLHIEDFADLCSADCEMMYQIGVDVLPEYRRKGIASAVTSRLGLEILALGKVPFYCAAWSNIKSVRNAIKSGFRPAWVELTARNVDFINKMIR